MKFPMTVANVTWVIELPPFTQEEWLSKTDMQVIFVNIGKSYI